MLRRDLLWHVAPRLLGGYWQVGRSCRLGLWSRCVTRAVVPERLRRPRCERVQLHVLGEGERVTPMKIQLEACYYQVNQHMDNLYTACHLYAKGNPPTVGVTQVSQTDVDEKDFSAEESKERTCTQQVFCRDSSCDARGATEVLAGADNVPVCSLLSTVASETLRRSLTQVVTAQFRNQFGSQQMGIQRTRVTALRVQRPHSSAPHSPLKGHCAGNARGQGGERGRVAVILEQGNPLQMIQLLQSPWEDRFRVCLDLARLLHFLSQSPLGSVALLDFQPRQFVTVAGELKLTDLDDASAEETACHGDADCTLQFPHRNFTLPCSARGVCEGLNEKRNIYNAYRYFFTYLLPHQAPPGLTHLVDHIMNSTGELKADINQTLEAFEHILLLYKSGLHLDNLPPSIIRDCFDRCRTVYVAALCEFNHRLRFPKSGGVLLKQNERDDTYTTDSLSCQQ
ncbi:hypothetical protein JOB18_022939, partial [Solea senegalensis]